MTYINELLAYQADTPEITDLNLFIASRSAGAEFAIGSENIYYYDFDRKIAQTVSAILQIRKLIELLQPDIIHIHSSYAGFLSRAACIASPVKPQIIYCAHGWSFNMELTPLKKRILALIELILAWKTNLIINVSDYEHNTARFYNLPTHKMCIIHNGVRARKTVHESDLFLNKDYINLLFVGRFDRQKGLDILLRVFSKYQLEKIKLYLLGNKILDDLSISIPQGVVNLGWIDQAEVDSYYILFDAVIIPSRWEGFSLVALEAMRNGKAVIASNRCSLPDVITHGFNGYLFDLENEQSLVDLLRGLDKTVLQEMGKNGYKFYEEYFTSQLMNAFIIKEYQRLIE